MATVKSVFLLVAACGMGMLFGMFFNRYAVSQPCSVDKVDAPFSLMNPHPVDKTPPKTTCARKPEKSLHNLTIHIKTVMRLCTDNNIMCELNAGYVVLAMAPSSVLLPHMDGDVFFHADNHSEVRALEPQLAKAGYSLVGGHESGQRTGAYFSYGSGWKLELRGKRVLDTQLLLAQGRQPTRINLDGQWVQVPRNVAREARDRYGSRLYPD